MSIHWDSSPINTIKNDFKIINELKNNNENDDSCIKKYPPCLKLEYFYSIPLNSIKFFLKAYHKIFTKTLHAMAVFIFSALLEITIKIISIDGLYLINCKKDSFNQEDYDLIYHEYSNNLKMDSLISLHKLKISFFYIFYFIYLFHVLYSFYYELGNKVNDFLIQSRVLNLFNNFLLSNLNFLFWYMGNKLFLLLLVDCAIIWTIKFEVTKKILYHSFTNISVNSINYLLVINASIYLLFFCINVFKINYITTNKNLIKLKNLYYYIKKFSGLKMVELTDINYMREGKENDGLPYTYMVDGNDCYDSSFENFNNNDEFISNIRSELLKIDLFDIPGTEKLKYYYIVNQGSNEVTDISLNPFCKNPSDIDMINSIV